MIEWCSIESLSPFLISHSIQHSYLKQCRKVGVRVEILDLVVLEVNFVYFDRYFVFYMFYQRILFLE